MKPGTFFASLSSTDFTVAPKRTGGITILPYTMPGSMTSMPYLADPLTFDGISSCGTETPIMVYWSDVLSLIALSSSGVKVLVALPLLTISANVIDFFDFGCEITESLTTSSPAGTPIAAAATSVNSLRPAAPAPLIASKVIIVLQLAPAIRAPSTGALNFGSLDASLTRTSV